MTPLGIVLICVAGTGTTLIFTGVGWLFCSDLLPEFKLPCSWYSDDPDILAAGQNDDPAQDV